MPRLVASVDGQEYLLENEQDAGLLLGVLSRARKLENNWKARGKDPRYFYAAEEGAAINTTVQILDWDTVATKPEPIVEPKGEDRMAAPAEVPF